MQRFLQFLTNSRTLAVIGFAALAALLLLGTQYLQIAGLWIGLIFIVAVLVWLTVWVVRKLRARQSAQQLGSMLEQQAETQSVQPTSRAVSEVAAMRSRMLEAIATIKTSKLGVFSGAAALYELPWYMVIGNPAAGKSTAIANSGLQFPFADKEGKVVHGIGGTRNCDWFFTTDGILLDTAGRYSVYEEHRDEWFGFLSLLKKYRRRAPINGIIIAVSVAELTGGDPQTGINLARSLRKRVQELTEKLEVFAPVYVMFTKVDLITGFSEFFLDTERDEKDRIWGATLPYSRSNSQQDVITFFDKHFDELYNGLKQMSLASMALNRGDRMPPGVFTFPLEFFSIKNPLRAFIATLFDENVYQFKPVLRGFYFTSALQEGVALGTSSERIAQRFDLSLPSVSRPDITSRHGFFLLNLFRQVIFADRDLVAQYASPIKIRLRYVMFFSAIAVLGIALGGWSWSYSGNRQLAANVQADLDKIVKLQDQRLDLQARFEALEILQDRIEQLEKYRDRQPWALGLGLYQGELLERKLREEYFSGISEILLKPVAANLENFLAEMNAEASKLEPLARPPQFAGVTSSAPTPGAAQPYKDASPTNVEDAYNALKTYLMLADKSRAEASHLNDQLTRFWRGWLDGNRGSMPREQMIRSAERLLTFHLAQVNDPSWPLIENKLSLVDSARENLRRVVRGLPARERVYADVKARAATRFPALTVARVVGDQDRGLMVGSYAIAGTFTRDAWQNFIEDAFKEAANKELQSADWVLKTAAKDDLTLEGSPEQIQKALVAQYKTEYAKEWQRFVQGVAIADLNTFDDAVNAMNRLGDPQNSPISKLINSVVQETSWDNPSLVNAGLQKAQRGAFDWFKETVLRQTPTPVNLNLNLNTPRAEIPMGPVGREFAGIAKLVAAKDQDASLMRGYLEALSKLRTRFNQLKNQGDPGPGAKQLMQQTLEGNGSELADALKYVDEQMLTGITDQQKQAIRPLLVRPLIQAFAVIVQPTEGELNKTWVAQVLEPFQKSLSGKYPFAADSKIEASNAEIGQIFGADGSIAKFVNVSMGPLVVRRGDALAAKTWANIGINLSPVVVSNFASWVAPLSAGGVAAANSAEAQTVFQIQPLPAPGTTEYTIEIDGQQVRYRNTQAQWTNMVWPNPQGTPGARISAVTFDGRTIEVINQPGRFGLEKLINAATRKRKEAGVFELTWSNGNVAIPVDLKIISSPQVSSTAGANQGKGFRGMRLPDIVVGGTPRAEVGLAAEPANSPAGVTPPAALPAADAAGAVSPGLSAAPAVNPAASSQASPR